MKEWRVDEPFKAIMGPDKGKPFLYECEVCETKNEIVLELETCDECCDLWICLKCISKMKDALDKAELEHREQRDA